MSKKSSKYPPVEIRPDANGRIDEIVSEGCDVHIERLTDTSWYLGIEDRAGHSWLFYFGREGNKVEFAEHDGSPEV